MRVAWMQMAGISTLLSPILDQLEFIFEFTTQTA
jgi:hypothetical protein